MKKIFILFVVLITFTTVSGQPNLDSLQVQVISHGKSLDVMSKTLATVKTGLDSVKTYVTVLKDKDAKADKDCIGCSISFIEWVLIFSPIWIFVFALFIIRKKLKGFNLKDALTESELPKKIIPNPEYTSDKINNLSTNPALTAILPTLIPPTIEITDGTEFPKSSSRYIALITSALTWIIVLCLSCFFIYQYIKTGTAPKLDGLSSVLLTLGIGVVPYAFNKISKAME